MVDDEWFKEIIQPGLSWQLPSRQIPLHHIHGEEISCNLWEGQSLFLSQFQFDLLAWLYENNIAKATIKKVK